MASLHATSNTDADRDTDGRRDRYFHTARCRSGDLGAADQAVAALLLSIH
mgnify:CR=1